MAKGRGGMFRPPNRPAPRGAVPGGISPDMLRQAQALQEKLAQAQEEIRDITVEAAVGGGVVRVVLGGDHRLRAVTIDPEALDPADPEMLQDLIVAAVNEAADKLEASQQAQISGLTGGLALPGLT